MLADIVLIEIPESVRKTGYPRLAAGLIDYVLMGLYSLKFILKTT